MNQELLLNEDQIKRATKNFWGIRYKFDHKGRFTAYANALTVFRDILRKVFKPHKCYHIFESDGSSCIRCGKTTEALLLEKREEIYRKKERHNDFWESGMIYKIFMVSIIIAFIVFLYFIICN